MRIQKFADIDRSYSPVTDKCGHSGLQSLILRQLHGLFTDFFRRRGHPTPLVSCNQFFYYKRGNPQVRVDPDLYIVDNETRPVTEILNWKTWTREGKPPTLALELIDDEYPKTYADQLHARYERLGVRELLIYPEPDRSPNHVRFICSSTACRKPPSTTSHPRSRSASSPSTARSPAPRSRSSPQTRSRRSITTRSSASSPATTTTNSATPSTS